MWELLENGSFTFNGGEAILDKDTPVYISIYEDGRVFVSNDPDEEIDEKKTVAAKPEFFNGNQLSMDIWKMKYAQVGDRTPQKTFDRIVDEIHRIENKYPNPVSKEILHELFDNCKHLVPGGSIFAGIGTKEPVSLANCFVIDGPSDSYGGIYRADQEMVQLMKRRQQLGVVNL